MLRILPILSAFVYAQLLGADEVAIPPVSAPLTAEQNSGLAKSLELSFAEAEKAVQANPKSLNGYSRRGDAAFFLGKFDMAVADYDKMNELDAGQSASNWRRGIALFYAGQFKEAALQFESYHSFDQVDRENGIWRYLSQHKAFGREQARQGLLKYKKDDREPFPAVYQLFAGKTSPDTILMEIKAADISDEDRSARLFYAHLYIGLNHAVEKEVTQARVNLAEATRNRWPLKAGYGPTYMWHVGRLHEEQLRKSMEK